MAKSKKRGRAGGTPAVRPAPLVSLGVSEVLAACDAAGLPADAALRRSLGGLRPGGTVAIRADEWAALRARGTPPPLPGAGVAGG